MLSSFVHFGYYFSPVIIFQPSIWVSFLLLCFNDTILLNSVYGPARFLQRHQAGVWAGLSPSSVDCSWGIRLKYLETNEVPDIVSPVFFLQWHLCTVCI